LGLPACNRYAVPNDDESKILPPTMNDRARPQANRTMLGVLLALLFVAVVLALWFLLFDNGDSASSSAPEGTQPTPLAIPTSTPVPSVAIGADDTTVGITTTDSVNAAPTTAPVATATPVPQGFEVCTTETAPLTAATYIVDTNTTPLNQRASPDVSGTQAGTFDPGQTGLMFTGECVMNVSDGYTWWKIFNGAEDVWIASAFVTPN
jgi:hypothetical protein